MQYIKLEQQDAVAIVSICRPEALNALNSRVLHELFDLFESIAKQAAIRAIVITGEGRAYVAGADIAEMKDFLREEAYAYAMYGQKVFSLIESMPQPVIAAINGYALGGGCELALACDIRIASSKAKFGQPEVGLGITPGFGGTQRLVQAVGLGIAMQMICTGKPIDAQEALRTGLINAVYEPETLLPEAMLLAKLIAGNAPLAVRAAKKSMRIAPDHQLDAGLAYEAAQFSNCFQTQDQKNAMQAFIDKKKLDAFIGK